MKRGGQRAGAGRPKGALARATKQHKATLGELARQHTDVAMKSLADVAKNGESESARVAASVALLDRGYGKPPQAIEHSGAVGSYDLTQLPDDQLASLAAILRSASITGGSIGGDSAAAE